MKPATSLALLPLLMLPLATLALGCSRGGSGRPSRLADGGYSLACKGPLSDCLRHAEQLCKDQGYTVREARDLRELFGHEAGQSRVVVERSDATIYCGQSAPREPIRLVREPEAAMTLPAKPAPATPPAAAARVCVPGATQACVGPGGCSGGQSCADDGSRFGDCNCGSAAATPSSAPTP